VWRRRWERIATLAEVQMVSLTLLTLMLGIEGSMYSLQYTCAGMSVTATQTDPKLGRLINAQRLSLASMMEMHHYCTEPERRVSARRSGSTGSH
jgi:hypothetical protein